MSSTPQPPDFDEITLVQTLETRTAERDRALELLDMLERQFPQGFSSAETQHALRETKALLVETGKRKSDAPPVWIDRR